MKIKTFQVIAEQLLKQHYGLTLNDTMLCDDERVLQCIQQDQQPFHAVSAHAQKFDLCRMDPFGMKNFLQGVDLDEEIAACQVLGQPLLNERFAQRVITDGALFCGTTVCPEISESAAGSVEASKGVADQYSVFAMRREGALERVGNHATPVLAYRHSRDLDKQYGWC